MHELVCQPKPAAFLENILPPVGRFSGCPKTAVGQRQQNAQQCSRQQQLHKGKTPRTPMIVGRADHKRRFAIIDLTVLKRRKRSSSKRKTRSARRRRVERGVAFAGGNLLLDSTRWGR